MSQKTTTQKFCSSFFKSLRVPRAEPLGGGKRIKMIYGEALSQGLPFFTHQNNGIEVISVILAIILASAAGIAAIDQIIKYFIVQGLAPNGSVTVINGLLSLTYVENRGVAFGMFQNHVWVFTALTSALIAVFIWMIVRKKFSGKLFYVCAALMIGGGIGNLIDRIFRGFVVDYLSLSFFPPVCNFADYCITAGAVMLVFILLFKSSRDKTLKEGDGAKVKETVSSDGASVSQDENAGNSPDGEENGD